MCGLDKEVVGAIDSGFAGLPLEEVIPAEPLDLSKNGLYLGGALTAASKLFRDVKHHKNTERERPA